jgi:hypothetical protein
MCPDEPVATPEPLDAAYARRIERVIEHICSHLEQDVVLDAPRACAPRLSMAGDEARLKVPLLRRSGPPPSGLFSVAHP